MSTLAHGPLDLAELELVEIWSKIDESERLRFFDRPSHKVTFDEPLMPMDDKALGY